MSWLEFLLWLLTHEGINAALGVVLSFVFDWYPDFDSLHPRVKRLAMAGLCLFIPLLGATLLWLGGYRALSWEDLYWPAVRAGGLAFLGNQLAHVRDLKRKPLEA
ncbi:MAG: hypothetical protein PHQ60_16420 [Sideroxydans sp.]|nr:hypothetical protein [Sideroxydans sp.]